MTTRTRYQVYLTPSLEVRFKTWMQANRFERESTAFNALLERFFTPDRLPDDARAKLSTLSQEVETLKAQVADLTKRLEAIEHKPMKTTAAQVVPRVASPRPSPRLALPDENKLLKSEFNTNR